MILNNQEISIKELNGDRSDTVKNSEGPNCEEDVIPGIGDIREGAREARKKSTVFEITDL